MNAVNITLIIIIAVLLICFILINSANSFKIGYYEQTIKNRKALFSKEKYDEIEKVMNTNLLFKLMKL